jgi:hypothetical protein
VQSSIAVNWQYFFAPAASGAGGGALACRGGTDGCDELDADLHLVAGQRLLIPFQRRSVR